MSIKLDMVGIVVKDMKRALDFYRTLGFDISSDWDNQAHVEVNQDGVRLAFDTVEVATSVYGLWEEPTGHRIELAFTCESAKALNDLYQRVMDQGYASHKEPWDAFWGQRYAILKDPDGNLISLFSDNI
ncbi:VOC family protein [Alkalicoccobacillus gibsonii]|uniref:VOC family protein n=1 Tax=Alkalicoccobacillus gibsonii TaxID=79881 RepID=UPI003F7CA109